MWCYCSLPSVSGSLTMQINPFHFYLWQLASCFFNGWKIPRVNYISILTEKNNSKPKSLGRNMIGGKKKNLLFSSCRKNTSDRSSLLFLKEKTEEMEWSFAFSKVYTPFTTMNTNFICCIPQWGSWWFWWMWIIVSMVLSNMRAASQFPYITPLGYHYPTLQKDSKDLLSSNPLRIKGLCIQLKES